MELKLWKKIDFEIWSSNSKNYLDLGFRLGDSGVCVDVMLQNRIEQYSSLALTLQSQRLMMGKGGQFFQVIGELRIEGDEGEEGDVGDGESSQPFVDYPSDDEV